MLVIVEKRSVEDFVVVNIFIVGGIFVFFDFKEMFGSEYDLDCYIVVKVGC